MKKNKTKNDKTVSIWENHSMGLHFGYNVMDSGMDFPKSHPSSTPSPQPLIQKGRFTFQKIEKKNVRTRFFFQVRWHPIVFYDKDFFIQTSNPNDWVVLGLC